MSDDLADFSMHELFRVETENQVAILTAGLLALERNPTASDELESNMRAAHSLKGAARIVGLEVGVTVAHAMEDCFVAAQRGQLVLEQTRIDVLLRGVDLLSRIAQTPETDLAQWNEEGQAEIDAFVAELADPGKSAATPEPVVLTSPTVSKVPERPADSSASTKDETERVLRVTAGNLNRLLGLASESLVESRWLKPFATSLLRLKRLHLDLGRALDALREADDAGTNAPALQAEARQRVQQCQEFMATQLEALDRFERRSTSLAHRLYDEALAVRMRPFADGVQGFPRLVRDVSRELGKQVEFEVLGENIPVDREILEKLEAPLGHLLRNAVDHGVESPETRIAAGKPAEAVLQLEAQHRAGTLQITVSDDGRGIDTDGLREKIVERGLTNAEMAAKLSESELLEFLFLPGFTLKQSVTKISGRGVGLDVVQTMVQQVRGTVRVSTERGRGTQFLLQLPLTLSVVRALLVNIGGEPYAFPLANIVRTLRLDHAAVEQLEGHPHFRFDGQPVGLVSARQVLGAGQPSPGGAELSVVIVGGTRGTYALVVDSFLGERELVVQPLDPRLGKIKDIAAGALMEDGLPVLIVDVEDLMRSMEKAITGEGLGALPDQSDPAEARQPSKRVLVVDDSLTVRELERKLLVGRGYEVETAVDGMDGWNAVRTGHFDLIITDVDMPRMDGIELLTLIKKDPRLQTLPVVIISYKDRESDRRRGLEAGADHYLTKGSFHDETMVQTVADLIGEPNE